MSGSLSWWELVLFLAVFLLVYGGSQAFLFWKVRTALAWGKRAGLIWGAWLALTTAAPFLERYLGRAGWELTARGLAYAGYTWMGLLFLFLCAYLLTSALRGLTALWPRLRDLKVWPASDRAAVVLAGALAALISVYGAFAAWDIRSEHVILPTAKLPAGSRPLRIVQISDVHLGLVVREARLARITARVRAAAPDLLVSTGDLVDGELNHISGLERTLRELPAPLGKYAVLGNHEFYAGLGPCLAFTRQAGFTVLRGERREVAGVLDLVGVDDPAGKLFGEQAGAAESALLAAAPRDRFTLLLKHRPVAAADPGGRFDLQLSGHTHYGQIFPFTAITCLFYPLDRGFVPLADGSALYVSRGSGTWGPPIRFLAPPEVTLIDLVPAVRP
jgi:uncharacterized protein